MTPWLVDTGPLVALLEDRDAHHQWALEQSRHAPAAVRTCEAVISETLFILRRGGRDFEGVFDFLDAGHIQCDFSFRDARRDVRGLMRRHADRAMSFADGCLVRMAELEPRASIWTLDRDFRHYRKFGRETLSLVAPW